LKADELCRQAESKLKSKMSFGGNKYKDALKLYEEAADLYEDDHQYVKAAEAHISMAKCLEQMKKPMDAAEAYADAAMNYRNDKKINEAIQYYEKSCQIFSEQGKFFKAAELHLEIADIYEKEHKLKDAVPHVQKAVDYYEAEEKPATLKTTKARLGHLNALAGYYDEAIEYFEEMAKSILQDRTDSLLKAREYLLKAGLCVVAQVKDPEEDLDMADDKIQEYRRMDKYFAKSPGYKLLDGILDAFEEKSLPLYQKALREYDDSEAEMDSWMTALLEVIYGNVKFAADEANDLT